MVYLFVRKTTQEKYALLAAGLYMVYPLAVYRLAMINTEIIQATALAFWGFSALSFLEQRSVRLAILLSILTAVLLYLNPAMQFMVPLFALFLFYKQPFWPTAKTVAAFLLPLMIICATWGMRNYLVTGDFFLFDVRGGKEFWLGNHQKYQGRWEGPYKEEWMAKMGGYKEMILEQGGTPNDFNTFMYKKGVEQILKDPLGAIVLDIKKFFRYWFVPASERMLKITIPVQGFYMLCALLGLLWMGVRQAATGIPLFLISYSCLIYTLSYACIRFSHPIMPWVCVLAGIGIGKVWDSRRFTQ
jgi:hypothetical protein